MCLRVFVAFNPGLFCSWTGKSFLCDVVTRMDREERILAVIVTSQQTQPTQLHLRSPQQNLLLEAVPSPLHPFNRRSDMPSHLCKVGMELGFFYCCQKSLNKTCFHHFNYCLVALSVIVRTCPQIKRLFKE